MTIFAENTNHDKPFDGQIRTVDLDGEEYFSVYDLVIQATGRDFRQAKGMWNKFKDRARTSPAPWKDELLRQVKKSKMISLDGKYRLGDVITWNAFEQFRARYLDHVMLVQKERIYRGEDEVASFHPKVITLLQSEGWKVEPYVKLPSGRVIDIIAQHADQSYLVECKMRLVHEGIYRAVGQVLCYCNEYGSTVAPMLATPKTNIDDYARQSCAGLGIMLLEV